LTAAHMVGRRFDARHVVGGLALVTLAAAAIADLWNNGFSVWDEFGPGASFFPLILALLLAVLGIALIWSRPQEQRTRAAGGGEEESLARPRTTKFVVLLAALIVLFPYLGGLLSLSSFVVAEMRWVERSSTWMSLAIGIVAFAAVWLIFVKLLSVPLPLGILPASFG